ncbi:MAG: hypothetical protein K2X48_00620 [Chitinophagaceae bacterium]|nr:hypothetical protein [Chitinophagaceae bacterium]
MSSIYDREKYRPIVDLNEQAVPPGKLPDIYFIVLDSYTSNYLLETEFHYNNADLYSFLRTNNFYVMDSSVSNYYFSPVSISSTFNLDYLPKASDSKDKNEMVLLSGLKLLSQSNLLSFLSKKGYVFYNFSPFSIDTTASQLNSHYNGTTDTDLLQLNTIENIDYETILSNFLRQIKGSKKISVEEKNIENKSKDLQIFSNFIFKHSKTSGLNPSLIYIHALWPHPPYVFDSTGSRLDIKFRKDTSYYGFVQQTAYMNRFIKEWVTSLRTNKPDAIIILQGDHGFRYFDESKNRRHAFDILNAVYLPNQKYKPFYATISSVNTFRLILNSYFGQSLPILKDTSYYLFKE